MKQLTLSCAVVAGLLCCSSAYGQGTTWYVDAAAAGPGTGTIADPYASIHYAVHQGTTVTGDTVLVLPGVYEETVEIVHKGITVRGVEGAVETIIDARGEGTTVTVIGGTRTDPVVLDGLTIVGGTGTWRDDHKRGGGILAEGAQLKILRTIVTENYAALGGGIASVESYVDMYDCEVRQNHTVTLCGTMDGRGGGIYAVNCGGLRMDQCGVRENGAALGGGIYAYGTSVALIDGGLRENVAFGMDFDANVAAGGGLWLDDTALWMENYEVDGNRAAGYSGFTPHGGGIWAGEGASAFLEDVVFTGNLAADPITRSLGNGGAIAALTTDVEGVGLLVKGNWAGTAGGGIWGPMVVRDSVIANNLAHVEGGGAWGAFLTDSVVSGNELDPIEPWTSTYGAGAFGGYLEYCTVKDNVAHGFGGEVDLASFGGGVHGAVLFRCELYDNKADFGGGASSSIVDASTIYANVAVVSGGGGGVYFARSGSLSNSIVWKNYNCQIVDFWGAAPVTYSDVQNGWTGVGNANSVPMFWDPDARDFHLKGHSECIDKGDPAAPPDPDGSRCDMGAHTYDANYCGLPSTYCEAKVNSMDCTPSIGFTGTPSLTGDDDFHIVAGRILNQRNGILLWSYLAADNPFGGGTLCLSTPYYRTSLQNSGGTPAPAIDCSGTYSFHYSQAEMNNRFMWVGRTFFAQYYYRDEGFAAPLNVGLTDGLRVTVCP